MVRVELTSGARGAYQWRGSGGALQRRGQLMLGPESTAIQLADGQTNPPNLVPAVVIRDVPAERLYLIEQSWQPFRRAAMGGLAEAGGGEHGHWDWRNKISTVRSGHHRLVAIECRESVQGLMAIVSEPRPARMAVLGSPLIYVDYVEAAPWNLKGLFAPPRFLGVGTALIAEAVKLSISSGCEGRIGLHSLPQAEKFYGTFCGMGSTGPDSDYYDLPYFEFTEAQAAVWLSKLGLTT